MFTIPYAKKDAIGWGLTQGKEINMKKILAVLAMVLMFCGSALAADVELKWQAAALATGYKIYQSTDTGATWDAGVDVGNVTEYTLTGVPDTGLVMWRLSAYNAYGETITSWQGGWYCGDWMPPQAAVGLSVGDVLISS